MTETLTPQREYEAPQELEAQPPPPPAHPIREPAGKPTVADVLERAADLLGEFGWGQMCELWSDMQHGPTCILGAIYLAHRDLAGASGDPYCVGARYLGGDRAPEYWGWNDAGGRTKADVVARLRTAASSARTKEEG